jgi:hypothetical protein
MDPLVGLLQPPQQQPQTLYTIRGPIYVEPSSLQAIQPAPTTVSLGPPVVGPPVIGPPVMTHQQTQPAYYGAAQVVSPPAYEVARPVLTPSPYNPYQSWILYDEQQQQQQDEVSPQSRRLNTNVQAGIQQVGQGNMNLQGNIQQINRRSSFSQQQQQAS